MEREIVEVTSPFQREYNWALGALRGLEKYKILVGESVSALERLEALNEVQNFLNEATRLCIYNVIAEEK